MSDLTPTERAVIRHLSGDLGAPAAEIAELTGLSVKEVTAARKSLKAQGLVEYTVLYSEHDMFMKGSGYILTPAGAEMCEAMERERRYEEQQQTRRLGDTSDLHAIAAQATREHGEPDAAMSVWTDAADGDLILDPCHRSFFSPPVKPSLWARVKAAFRRAA